MYEHIEILTRINSEVSKLLISGESLNIVLQKFTTILVKELISLDRFLDLKLHKMELELNDFSKDFRAFVVTNEIINKKTRINQIYGIIPRNVAVKKTVTKTEFIALDIISTDREIVQFPIYLNYSNDLKILNFIIEFKLFKSNKYKLDDTVKLFRLVEQLIEMNFELIINSIQRRISEKIDSINLQGEPLLKRLELETELKQISKVLEDELGYSKCSFLIKLPETPNHLTYFNQKNLRPKLYNTENDDLLAVKSFIEHRDIKLITHDSIVESTNRVLSSEIEREYMLSENLSTKVKLVRWLSINISGRESDTLGLIRLFQFKSEFEEVKFFSTAQFVLLRNIQRTIYHIVKDYFIFRNEIKSRNNVIDNLMHQIISPLNALGGHCRNLTRKISNLSNNHEKVFYIRNLANECSDKANSFQTLIKLESNDLESNMVKVYDIRLEVLKKIIDYQPKAAMDKQISIHLINSPKEGKISAKVDQELFSHVVSNLIDNAIKYSYDSIYREELGYAAKPESNNSKENILFEIKKTVKNVEIFISNLGAQIDQSEKSKIFDRKYRGINSNDFSTVGNGLGLYIVKNFVNLMGGEISLQDTTQSDLTIFKLKLVQ